MPNTRCRPNVRPHLPGLVAVGKQRQQLLVPSLVRHHLLAGEIQAHFEALATNGLVDLQDSRDVRVESVRLLGRADVGEGAPEAPARHAVSLRVYFVDFVAAEEELPDLKEGEA